MSKRFRLISCAVFIILLIFLLLNTFGSYRKNSQSELEILNTGKAFTEIAKKVIPTVVSIHSTMILKTRDLWKNRYEDGGFQDSLSERYDNFPIPKEFRQRGSGSGIIISKEGHILTNVHVVENAEYIEISLHDKRTFEAEIIGFDPLTEVAIVKIEAQDLPVAILGNSETCEIGEWVIAVGNPLELNSTITAGIISAMGRDINIIRDTYGVENFIQTDAAINPGNSGGALVNLKGEVIGISTAIATESGYNQGYGFAIPINLAKVIMQDLIHKGRVVRGYLGIAMQDIDEKKARALGLKKPLGVFIDSVSDDGPAMKAGLREKDVLIKIGDQVVNNANIVQSIIAEKSPGDELVLTFIRKNKDRKITVTLGERQQIIIVPPVIKKNRTYKNLGLDIESIKSRFASDLGIYSEYGVLVISVERFSPSFEAGIHINDVILEIGDRKIMSIEMFYKTLASLKKGDVTIIKVRRGDTLFHAFVEM